MAAEPQRQEHDAGWGPSLLWAGAGALLGVTLEPGLWGLVSGAALGLLWVRGRAASARAEALACELSSQAARLGRLEAAAGGRAPVGVSGSGDRSTREADHPPGLTPEPGLAVAPGDATAHAPTPSAAPPPPPAGASPLGRAAAAARALLFGGNTVVRTGVLVLLVGVLLLAKWAADHALFPLEARLAVATLIGLALTGVGYRVRRTRPGFGTSLQGGGIGALYLVVFISFRVFALLPAGLAFTLFVAIALASGSLAVLQRSQPLIFIASLGGFLAPVLASTGEGSHVALFGYYLVLNGAVAAVSWFRDWRALNLLAFACTYGVAVAWGVLRYRPEQFASTEPFLLAYFLLFTGIAVVFAWRRPPRLTGLVDGTLVFGTALVTLLAQARLVAELPHGMALSTAGLGLFYAALGSWLFRTAPETLRRLSEAFVALAVGFGTLAIPLALDDGLSTSMVWALEGAGLFWVGARQHRPNTRRAGMALQGLSAGAFLYGLDAGFGGAASEIADRVGANARFMACAALAFGGWFIGREGYVRRAGLARRERLVAEVFPVWGLGWWIAGGAADVDAFVAARYEVTALLVFTAVTAWVQERVAARLGWAPGRRLALWCLPGGYVGLGLAPVSQPHLLAHGGAVAWPLLVAALYAILVRLEADETDQADWPRLGYVPALLLVALVASIAAKGATAHVLGLSGDWPQGAFAAALAAVLVGARRATEAGIGPFGRLASLHLGPGLASVAALALLAIAGLNLGGRGDAEPLPYLPLLGPIDLAVALLAIALLGWWRSVRAREPAWPRHPVGEAFVPVLGALAFLWLNALLARSVHQWTGVPFSVGALWRSAPFQVSLSITWTLVALVGMWLATRRGLRATWLTFAALLGVVVLKLFTVDLSQLGTGAKIVTFLVVGVLVLVVGWLSPVPPGSRPAKAAGEGAAEAAAREGGAP